VATLRKGVDISPRNLKISDRATICMPYHKLLDELEEDRLGDKKFGSTRRGIAPVYADKYMKKSLRMGDLLYPATLKRKVEDLMDWKNLTIEKSYGHEPISAGEMVDWLKEYGDQFRDYVCDISDFLDSACDDGLNVLFEAQLGALKDIDFGIYPYTSSSSTLAAYAPLARACRADSWIGWWAS
jgi:adenylosuccinate synthase